MAPLLLLFFLLVTISCGGGDNPTDTDSGDTAPLTVIQSANIPELIHLGPSIKLSNGDILLGGATSSNAVIYRSTNNGDTWNLLATLGSGGSGDPVMGITQLASGKIFAGTNAGNMYSSNDEVSWIALSNTPGIGGSGAKFSSIANRIYIIASTALHYSDDDGATWSTISNVANNYTSLLAVTPSKHIVVGCCSGGPSQTEISIAHHDTLSFSSNLLGLADLMQRPRAAVVRNDGSLLVIGGRFKTWESTDYSSTQYLSQAVVEEVFVHSGIKVSNTIIASTSSILNGAQLYISNNDGSTFTESGITGYLFDKMLELDSSTILGFEMLSYDGNHPTNIYKITIN